MVLRGLRVFAIITAIGSYLMVLWGAVVTKTGSGKGCGNSWPFCHGQLIPASLPVETVIEYGHRIISGGVGLLIVILTVWSWIRFKENRVIWWLAFSSLFFVLLQGGLGALTVVFEDVLAQKTMLALHFGFSLLCLASVILLTLSLYEQKHPRSERLSITVSPGMRLAIWGITIYSYLVVYSGALVRHAGATMGCGYSFPFCGERWLPDLSSQPGIQLLHRYAAILLWFLVAFFVWQVVRNYRDNQAFVRIAWWAFALITIQALSGIATIQMNGQLMIALIHTTVISLFFSLFCYLWLKMKVSEKTTIDNTNDIRYT